jgi:hypothetical protein
MSNRPKNGKVVVLIPKLFSTEEVAKCQFCPQKAEFYTRIPGGEFKLLCKRHHQSYGLGFGPDLGYKLETLLNMLEEDEDDDV